MGGTVGRKNAPKDNADAESKDEDEGVFSTDATFETRLLDLLTISASQGYLMTGTRSGLRDKHYADR